MKRLIVVLLMVAVLVGVTPAAIAQEQTPDAPQVVTVEDNTVPADVYNRTVNMLGIVIVVLFIVTGALLGKSSHELARSYPIVQAGYEVAKFAAGVTPRKDDDETVKKVGVQLGLETTESDKPPF